MTLKFYECLALDNRVDKTDYLTELSEVSEVHLKEDTSIVKPSFLLVTENDIYKANYCYCRETDRYYYIIDTVATTGGALTVNCRCDVLMTYKTSILNSPAWIEKATEEQTAEQLLYNDNEIPFRADFYTKGITFPTQPFNTTAPNFLLVLTP